MERTFCRAESKSDKPVWDNRRGYVHKSPEKIQAEYKALNEESIRRMNRRNNEARKLGKDQAALRAYEDEIKAWANGLKELRWRWGKIQQWQQQEYEELGLNTQDLKAGNGKVEDHGRPQEPEELKSQEPAGSLNESTEKPVPRGHKKQNGKSNRKGSKKVGVKIELMAQGDPDPQKGK
jgi:hypothetical protein